MYRLNSATTLPPLLLVQTLGINPHFSYPSSLLLSYNLTTATVCLGFACGKIMSRELSQLNRYLWNLKTTFQNCFLFTFLYCEILPLQFKSRSMRRLTLAKLSMHERQANQRCGVNLAIKRPVLSLLLFSSIQEKNLNSNHSPITKEKTRLQSSD